MNTAQALAACLVNEGVKRVFALPGEEVMELMEAMLDHGIELVITRHEQGAAFMADVTGRLTGEAGVCMATLGPGAANLVTGVADADCDRAPLVAITGQASLDRTHKESHQYLDLVSLFEPITKWNMQIKRPLTVAESVRTAFRFAEQERPGATHIDVPEDVALETVPDDIGPLNPTDPKAHVARKSQVDAAVALLKTARHPLILAGNGVIRGHSHEYLQRFAETLNIPVAKTFMGKGIISFDHPLSIGTLGLQARDHVNCGFDRADVVISIGYDLIEYAPANWNPDKRIKVLHVDRSPAEVDAHYMPTQEVTGDCRVALSQMMEQLEPWPDGPIHKLHSLVNAELQRYRDDQSMPMKPQRVLLEMRDVLAPDDILISDVGAHKIWIARMFPTIRPNTCIISNGFASMGIALPGAIAAKLVHPERQIMAVAGDGGALMNIQELETAVRMNTPFVMLVWTDGRYGLIDWKQRNRYGHSRSVSFGNPDWVKLAESFGCKGVKVATADELTPAMQWGYEQTVPVIIEVPIDGEENMRLTQQMGEVVCSM
ncbi:MAG: acetolactate synthase large subunit [Gammaproteobacteria bacterium]|nr:acetolactate synthase large subunit [Gammaproteobacteria bacterium]